MFSWNENLHQFLNLHYVKDHFISEYWWASSLGCEAMCILLLLSAVLYTKVYSSWPDENDRNVEQSPMN